MRLDMEGDPVRRGGGGGVRGLEFLSAFIYCLSSILFNASLPTGTTAHFLIFLSLSPLLVLASLSLPSAACMRLLAPVSSLVSLVPPPPLLLPPRALPHTDRTGGRRSFSPAEAAGVALERRPSRLALTAALNAGRSTMCPEVQPRQTTSRPEQVALMPIRHTGALGRARDLQTTRQLPP